MTAVGFADRVVTQIKVDPSETIAVSVSMTVASSTTTVEITAESALVQTANADLALTVDTRTIQDTALLSRNVFDLAFLARLPPPRVWI